MLQEQTRVTVRLTGDQDAWLATQVRPFLSKSDVIRDLIDTARQGLDTSAKLPAYRVGAGTQDSQMAVTAVEQPSLQKPASEATQQPPLPTKAVDSKARKFEPLLSDPKLKKFEDDILAFWKAKKGAKNERAWSILLTELGKIRDKYGDSVLVDQLQLGIQSGTWNSISLARYEQFKPRGITPAQPEHKHPAYRPASEVLAESERLAQQNLEHLRRKQEEAQPVSGPLADLF